MYNSRRPPLPTADQTVTGVLTVWPQAIQVFLDRRMACVGCAMAGFDTVADAATNYGQAPDDLVAALRRAVLAPGVS